MKKMFAQISYTFSNFYDNLSNEGKTVFTIIVGLILILFLALLITSIIQKINAKRMISKYIKKDLKEDTNPVITEIKKENIEKSEKSNEVKDIAKRIEDALNDDSPVTLTSFEEDQERTAIISIDELMQRAKELELIDDEPTGVNYLEKYNLEPALVEEVRNKAINNEKQEVKAFKVSQVISPIYGVKKDIVDNDK